MKTKLDYKKPFWKIWLSSAEQTHQSLVHELKEVHDPSCIMCEHQDAWLDNGIAVPLDHMHAGEKAPGLCLCMVPREPKHVHRPASMRCEHILSALSMLAFPVQWKHYVRPFFH